MDPPPFYEEGKSTPEEKIRPGEVDCDICSEVQAVKFCQTCSVTYCETHIRQHYTVPKLQKHTLVDVTRDLVQKLCHHDYSPLEVFCRTDQMLICSQCAETNHKGHDTTLLETKKAGRQSCDGDQHTMLLSDDVLPPPGDIQVLLLTFNSVSLSWSSPQWLTGPQTFRVTWGCDSETSSTRVEGGHQLEISSLQPGEKYQFSVATEGEDGRQSRWVSASLSTVVPPRDLKMDHLEETSFTLHWSKAEGMEKVPQRFLISNCIPGTDPLTAVTDDCHRTFSNLQPGTEYTVSVTTVLSNGEQSEPVSTSICTILPAPDQLTVDSVDPTSAAVSWSQPPGLDQTQHQYQISYHCPGTEPHITTTSSHSITLSDLQFVNQYFVTVCTVLENGKQSRPVSTTLTTVLPAPDQLTVDSVNTTSAAVSWSQPPGLDQTQHHYQISYRCPGTEPHITTTSSHSITLSDLQPATEYSVTVCTVLENGRQSQLVLTTLTTVLPAPDQLTVDSVDTTSAAVSWSQPPGLDQTQHHYQISYHCPGTEPHITTTSSHSITLSDLQGGTQYFVTVCTVLENGKQSQLVSTTLTTIPPAPDQLTVDSVNTTSAAVSWSQPPGLDQTQHHYQISYRCPGTEPHITTTPSHSITLSDLQPATEYSVTVCTVLENGKHSQLVSTTLTTVHFQWGKRPSRVAAVCVLLALIIGLWDSYATAERDQLQNSLNTRTTERDQLQNSLNTRTTERDQLQNSLNTRTTEIDKLIKSLNTTTMERDQLQKEIERLNWENKGSCPEGWRRFGCRCYYLSTEKKSWEKSRQDCLERGADLVIINSEEEQTFINGFKSVSYVWIGLTDSVTEGTWKWVDDTPLTSPKYWWSGEPGGGTYQNCGEIYYISSGQGVWRDLGCSFSQEWICEK
uniref:Uncharacterized protein n=1 Tax=Hucho hucho TaxID=62062 RepID=A0A4W5RS87_9TELE